MANAGPDPIYWIIRTRSSESTTVATPIPANNPFIPSCLNVSFARLIQIKLFSESYLFYKTCLIRHCRFSRHLSGSVKEKFNQTLNQINHTCILAFMVSMGWQTRWDMTPAIALENEVTTIRRRSFASTRSWSIFYDKTKKNLFNSLIKFKFLNLILKTPQKNILSWSCFFFVQSHPKFDPVLSKFEDFFEYYK